MRCVQSQNKRKTGLLHKIESIEIIARIYIYIFCIFKNNIKQNKRADEIEAGNEGKQRQDCVDLSSGAKILLN